MKDLKVIQFKDDHIDVYMVMSYGGQSLASYMQRNRHRYNESTVIHLYFNLLRSLAFIHSAGVMHRDLKPENILVGKDLSVMICDFGIARTETEHLF
mmetsp:Transcript_31688/g.48519  ORF Transcript_31688/g.48519 Transcript_31688/m.48519 type:complete len:97 (-) Transcript_31688:767-1057(-)